MQTATDDPLVGRVLEGRYRIHERIARGGMSVVYAAVDERLDRRVAVKVMSSALSADPKFSDRFASEARAAARLAHINAVAVYDQGQDNSAGHHVFLVMELVTGRTLRDLIRERSASAEDRGRFSPAEAVSIMEPVLSALSAAHRAGLVHRDIKPENILLSDDGLVKVADFGLARAVDADAASTRTGLMMGTVAYCAPEQIVHGRTDQRSDVYSAGIVLFELLTGHPPYAGDSAMHVAYQHVHSRVPAPSSRVRGIPTPIDEIVVAATDSDPAGRPSDASALLAEMADARAQLALPVVPIPPRRRAAAPTRGRGSSVRPAAADARAARSGTTAPVRSRTASAVPTDLLDERGWPGHDTIVAQRPGAGAAADGPPPPIVIPPPGRGAGRSPAARRRRRRIIVLVAMLLLGAASVGGGITAVRMYREWNTHVPAVSGLPVAAARASLQQRGYAVDDAVTSSFSETVPKGRVITTDPPAGGRLPQGKPVRLVVSLGKDRVPVPDVTKRPVGTAESVLQGRGLQFDPSYRTRHSTTVPSGSVIATDPPAGAQIKRTTRIALVVSSGLPTVDVPAIAAGTPIQQARAALRKAHLRVAETDATSDTVPKGGVISLDPADQALWGDTVTVTVSTGPPLVTVPDYTRLEPYAELEAQLRALGLVPEVKKLLGGEEGRVWSTDPASGIEVPTGSTVTVSVI